MHPLILALLLSCSADPALTPLPGAPPPPAELAGQLLAARDALPPDARRTRHLAPDGLPRYTNRLALESSPYLRQHAHHPVDWRPWGPEAFAEAAAQNKPILLSIGYATCHWCHVMARESFDDEEIAAVLNARYLPIKVDREERPDVDATYMEALVALRGRGGWPATLVLTPDGQAFFAATYLPPHDGDRGVGRGLMSVLTEIAEVWEADPDALVADAARLTQHLARATAPSPPGDLPPAEVVTAAASRLLQSFDRTHGGFGTAPKFPRPAALTLLLRTHRRTGDPELLDAVVRTLHAMADGAIYDQLGGGFHRYTTDAAWQVPHFEKTLYDQALLASVYLEAFQATGDPELARIGRETLEFVAREMSLPGGGFASATDAESAAPDGSSEEGRYFTWTAAEIRDVVGDDAPVAWYGVEGKPTVGDRHALRRPQVDDADAARLSEVRRALYQARSKRPAPALDDKAVTAWNALMISAFVQGYQVFGEEAWKHRAARAGDFALRNLRARDRRVHRSWRDSLGPDGVLEDVAFLIQAMLDLYEATGQLRWLDEAVGMQRQQDALFAAEAGAWQRSPKDAHALVARVVPTDDGAEPSGNSVALRNVQRIGGYLADRSYDERAERGFRALSHALTERGHLSPLLMTAYERYLDAPREIVIVGEPGPERDALVSVVHEAWLPNRVLAVLEPGDARQQSRKVPLLQDKEARDGPTAYVCERSVCAAPTGDPDVLRTQLRDVRPL